MTQIVTHAAPEPVIADHIQEELAGMDPRVFLVWNARWRQIGEFKSRPIYEPRWEIWCELRQVAHPEAQNELAQSDRWNPDAGCWMRKLQTYKTADGGFAPADWGLVTGLRAADAWERDNLYEKQILEPEARKKQESRRRRNDALGAGSRYYEKIDEPIVGRHVNSGWRHKIR